MENDTERIYLRESRKGAQSGRGGKARKRSRFSRMLEKEGRMVSEGKE